MFRFKQRLAQILGDRGLSSAEQSGLDAYDIELEDALSNISNSVTTTTAGVNYWKVASGTLQVDTATVTATEVFISPTVAGNAGIVIDDNGVGTGDAQVYADRDIIISASDDVSIAGSDTVSINGANDARIISTVYTLQAAPRCDIQCSGASGLNAINLIENGGGNINLSLSGGAGNVIITGLPTASAGLPTGAIWNNAGVLNIV